jgi:hypothetical protein
MCFVANPFDKHLKSLTVGSKEFHYYNLSALGSKYGETNSAIIILHISMNHVIF